MMVSAEGHIGIFKANDSDFSVSAREFKKYIHALPTSPLAPPRPESQTLRVRLGHEYLVKVP